MQQSQFAGQANLFRLLSEATTECTADLAALSDLFRLDLTELERDVSSLRAQKRVSRTTASRIIATATLRALDPDMAEASAKWVYHNAGAVLAWERRARAPRTKTIREMWRCHERWEKKRRNRRPFTREEALALLTAAFGPMGGGRDWRRIDGNWRAI